LDVPDTHGRVAEEAAADGLPAVGGERHGPHLVRVPLEAADLLAGLQVPQPNGLVLAARQQHLAVARHVQPVDRALLALVPVQLLARLQVPDADRPFAAPRDGPLAARQEGEAVHAHGVPLQLQQLLARGHLPQAHGRVTVPVAGAAGEGPLAVGREGDDHDTVGVPLEAADGHVVLHLAGPRRGAGGGPAWGASRLRPAAAPAPGGGRGGPPAGGAPPASSTSVATLNLVSNISLSPPSVSPATVAEVAPVTVCPAATSA